MVCFFQLDMPTIHSEVEAVTVANEPISEEPTTEPNPDNQFIVSADYLEPEAGQVKLHEGDLVEVMQKTLSGYYSNCAFLQIHVQPRMWRSFMWYGLSIL